MSSKCISCTILPLQLLEFLGRNKEVFSSSLAAPAAETKVSMHVYMCICAYIYNHKCICKCLWYPVVSVQSTALTSAVQHLRARATGYMRRLQRVCSSNYAERVCMLLILITHVCNKRSEQWGIRSFPTEWVEYIYIHVHVGGE